MVASAAVTLALGRGADPNRVYFGTDTRCFELLAGVLLALGVGMRQVRMPRWAGPAAFVVMLGLWAVVGETDRWLDHGGLWLVAGLSCVVIVAAGGTGWVARVLAWPPLVALGKRSYGVYVYHWPLFLLLDRATTGLVGLSLAAVRVGATAALAEVSYRRLEQPIRHRRWRLSRRALVAGVLVPVVALLAALAVSTEAPGRAVAAVAAHPVALAGVTPSAPAVASVPAAPLRRVLFVG